MRLASINLRSCLGKPAKLLQARSWLAAHKPDFALVQDPGGARVDLRTVFPGWKLLDATELVATWQRGSIISSKPIYLESRIQLLNYRELVFANAYLCPNSSAKRALSLELLRIKLQEINKKAIVTGDFNFAPEAHDDCVPFG
jgi:endonuclease/exonuclease/phosphatase family metal-dependent hydrolase